MHHQPDGAAFDIVLLLHVACVVVGVVTTAAAAATAAPASSPAPSGNALPPAARAHLKAGTVTTFGNGQQWTLDEHGQPKQVK